MGNFPLSVTNVKEFLCKALFLLPAAVAVCPINCGHWQGVPGPEDVVAIMMLPFLEGTCAFTVIQCSSKKKIHSMSELLADQLDCLQVKYTTRVFNQPLK